MKMAVIFLLLAVVTTACVKVHGVDGEYLDVVPGELGLVAIQSVDLERTLIAQVKGSIYESGEAVSVFGTCLDAFDTPFPAMNASFSAWYPNGTQFINETNVTEIEPGYFLFTTTMSVVRGTYLTQLRCSIGDEFALAFGEWQNPEWVGKINETITQINNTQTFINETFINLSNQITIVGQIANDSVDRNDSLIVQLLFNLLINGSPSTGPGGVLNFTEEFTAPVFHGLWEIDVTVFIGTTQVGSADARCFINTTNANPTINAQMEPIAGPKFHHQEIVRKRFDFDWDVACEPV